MMADREKTAHKFAVSPSMHDVDMEGPGLLKKFALPLSAPFGPTIGPTQVASRAAP